MVTLPCVSSAGLSLQSHDAHNCWVRPKRPVCCLPLTRVMNAVLTAPGTVHASHITWCNFGAYQQCLHIGMFAIVNLGTRCRPTTSCLM